MIDYRAGSRKIQELVSGAVRDPAIRKRANANPTTAGTFHPKLGGHWMGRILSAAFGTEPLYRVCPKCDGYGFTPSDVRCGCTLGLGVVKVWPVDDA